jgi:GDP-D-mannose dehydratase
VTGDATKAHQSLAWAPKTTFSAMIKKMIDFDLEVIDSGTSNKCWKPE